jgi:hypothetical protein
MTCVKEELLEYLNTLSGVRAAESRSFENLDEQIFNRVSKILRENDFRMKIGSVDASYTQANGFDVHYDESKEGKFLCN